MSLRTRLDSRSDKNDRFTIVDDHGNVLAEVKAHSTRAELEVVTCPGLHIEKPSGFKSKGDVNG